MERKFYVLLLIVILAIFPILSGCAQEEAAEEDAQNISLQFATFWPALDFQVVEGHEVWAQTIKERVEEETPHTISFNFQAGGVLLGPTEIYQGVADGSADIGSTCPNYTVGVFPLTEGIELPGYNNDNALVASMTMQEAFLQSPELQAEYDDVKVMFFWATGPGDFLTQKPVRNMDDLKGMRIRAAGGSALAISALGGVPVPMAMSQSYENLDSGQVEAVLGPTDTLKGFNLARLTNYITKTPFVGYNVVFVKVMNKDTWDSLPASVQKIFEEVNEEFVAEYGKLRTDHTVLGQEYAVENYEHEVIELEESELAKWQESIAHITQDWVEDREAEGLEGQKVYDLFKSLDEEYSQKYGSYGSE